MTAAVYASVKKIRRRAVRAGLRPPPRLSLDEWADRYFRLSAESAAVAGKWTTLPYQRGIMRAITDPTVTHVSVMKSARVGYTLMVSAAIGYFIHQAPAPILLVQPTVEDAEEFSKDTIAPMLTEVPVLAKIVFKDVAEKGPKGSGNTISSKRFPGGVLQMIGANSGRGFRRVSRKVVIFDEVDGYPASAGSDGDPIELGTKRADYYWDRKILAGSTPKIAGLSRIEQKFNEGDQRRFYVPCPHCDHFDHLVFTERESGGGHFMKFDVEAPELAHFVCSANGCVIEHSSKRDMVARGEWRAAKPFEGHASFHIWAAYSFSPNASWGQLAKEFLRANALGPLMLKVFVNTVLGESWKESGEAPDWERLYQRRENYTAGTVPAGVKFLTCGVDVQKDRWVYEVVGWGAGRESWSIDIGVIPGDTGNDAHWAAIDELTERTYLDSTGVAVPIGMTAIDSGFRTSHVYNYVRRKSRRRVMAVKGVATATTILGSPSKVDVMTNGKKIARGCQVWPIGSSVAKDELYSLLKLEPPTTESGEAYPPGYCHAPQHEAEYFKQLTGEHLVSTRDKRGFPVHAWHVIPGRENHWLDCRNYARAAANIKGLDKMKAPPRAPLTSEQIAAHMARTLRPQAPSSDAEKIQQISHDAAKLMIKVLTPKPVLAPPKPKKPMSDGRLPRAGFLGMRGGWLTKKR